MTVNANAPSQVTRLWEELLLWFGPALLFGGLLAWWMRSGGAGAPGGLGGTGMGKSTARRLRPLLGQATPRSPMSRASAGPAAAARRPAGMTSGSGP